MKTYWGNGGIAPPFLTSALHGSELASRCGTAGLDAVEKRKKIPAPAGNRTPVFQLIA
jgi:hypothetical protein